MRKQTLANLYPQIDASGQYTRSIVKQEMAKGLSFGADNTLTATGNISLALFVPSVYRQLKMNRTEMAAAVESARSSRIDLVADVRQAFYNVLLAEQSYRVLQESVATTQRVVDNTERLFNNGLASEYDFISAKVQLSNLRPSVLQAENAIELSKLQLKMYLSIPEDVDIAVAGSLDDLRNVVLLGSDNLSTDISHNSSLRTLDLQRELLEHQVKLIQTQRMPTIAAFGSAIYTGNDMERMDFSSMMGGGSKPEGGTGEAIAQASSNSFWWQHPINVGLQISIPIFSGFSKTNQSALGAQPDRAARPATRICRRGRGLADTPVDKQPADLARDHALERDDGRSGSEGIRHLADALRRGCRHDPRTQHGTVAADAGAAQLLAVDIRLPVGCRRPSTPMGGVT